MTLIAAADGSALGNPGPAGWGWYIDEDRWASGGWPHGTNNMGELTAVLDLLQQTAGCDEDLLVYCDSMYAINSITKWMPGWKRKGWRKGDGKPVLNVDIMKALDAAMQGRRVRFEWVKGHAGHELNTEADRLANAAAVAFKEGRKPDAGPGFSCGAGVSTRSSSGRAGVSTGSTSGAGSTSGGAGVSTSSTGGAAGVSTSSTGGEGSTSDAGDQPDLFSLDSAEASHFDRVVALERSLLTDEVRTDPAALAALLHPDWCEIGRSGRLLSRAEVLTELGPLTEAVELEPLSASEPAPGTVLLLWRARTPSRTTLRSSLWVLDGGDWRQRYHQGTDEG